MQLRSFFAETLDVHALVERDHSAILTGDAIYIPIMLHLQLFVGVFSAWKAHAIV